MKSRDNLPMRLRTPKVAFASTSNSSPGSFQLLDDGPKPLKRRSKLKLTLYLVLPPMFLLLYLTNDLSSTRFHQAKNQYLPFHVPMPPGSERCLTGPSAGLSYLAYLPHSGFHNQRISLENAIVLSQLLNRTLLVPPIHLANPPLQYMEFDRLYHFFLQFQKDKLLHCTQIGQDSELPIECLDYSRRTYLSWHSLTNISSIVNPCSFLEVWNFDADYLERTFGVSGNDTYFLKDEELYQYRFYEDPNDPQPHDPRFSRRIDIPVLALQTKEFRLLQVGTLFGTRRLRLTAYYKSVLKKIRGKMAFENPLLHQVSNAIRNELYRRSGGTSFPGYVAVHVRIGDGEFERKAEQNAQLVWRMLVTGNAIGLTAPQASVLQESLSIASPSVGQLIRSPPPRMLAPSSYLKYHTHPSCSGPFHSQEEYTSLNTPLFIATDIPTHPALSIFRNTFPCIFFLDSAAIAPYLTPLRIVYNDYDGIPLFDYLISFVDAMVAAKGQEVYGTPESTFSQFVIDVLWRRYHGLENVSRG